VWPNWSQADGAPIKSTMRSALSRSTFACNPPSNMIRVVLAALSAVVGILASPVADAQGGDLTRRADTPNFYFVTTSSDSSSSLKPVLFDSSLSPNYAATLTGTGPPIQFFFESGESWCFSPALNSIVKWRAGLPDHDP
jgi:hypothetical protein